MVGLSPGCYIPSFVEIGLPVPEKKIFKGFYHIWAFLRKLGLDFCMYTTLGQGQEITLTFNTHTPSYIHLDVCSY